MREGSEEQQKGPRRSHQPDDDVWTKRQFSRRARRAASTRHCRLLRPQIINVSVHDTGMAWGHIIRPLDTDLTSIPCVIYYSKTQVIMS